MDPVYLLEDRGFNLFYHWIFYMLASLRQIEKQDRKVDIYMPWFHDYGYHRDSLKYFEEHFNFFFKESEIEGRELIVHPGETILGTDRIAEDGYHYVRNKILKYDTTAMIPGKFVYITRNGCEKLESNVDRGRHHSVINEPELINMLSAFGFQIVTLETLSFAEKVKLYREAEIVIAPYGGSLVPSVFGSLGQTIIELSSIEVVANGWQHYGIICDIIGIRYYAYRHVNYRDEQFNIHVKLEELYKLLCALIKS